MKVRIKNIKNKEIVKEIESNLLGDYLATKEWEKVKPQEEEKPQENNRGRGTAFNTSSSSEE